MSKVSSPKGWSYQWVAETIWDGCWENIRTVPRGRRVMVLTARGLVRRATVTRYARVRRNGTVHCMRCDRSGGDFSAVAWRELTAQELIQPGRNAKKRSKSP